MNLSERMARTEPAVLALGLLALLTLVVFIPTGFVLAKGPWDTEQDGHGPFILAAAAYIAWTKLPELTAAPVRPAPWAGWALLVPGMALMVLARSQEVLAPEVLSLMPIFAGSVLLTGGWRALKVFLFPIALLFFAIPPPGWALDTLTLPLKVLISDVVTRVLYAAGYPIAQNGVVIMIGPYQLLVKDACAGMNSIFALSAIGFLYVYVRGHASKLRNLALLAAVLPIAIAANFIRVMALVLIAYTFGPQAIEGVLHDFTGIALFAMALFLFIALDGVFDVILRLFGLRRRPASVQPAADPARHPG